MKTFLTKISFFILSTMVTSAPMGCAQSNYYDIFVRPEKLEELKKAKGSLWETNIDIIKLPFEAGMIRFWLPKEIPPPPKRPHTPTEPYIGKFRTEVELGNDEEKFPISFRLLKFNILHVDPALPIQFLYGDYYESKTEQYRKFTHPSEISEDRIVEKITGNSIKMILDIPKQIKSFDIAFEVEVSYEGKTEIVKFQSHFIRSKYHFLPPD